MEVWKVRDHDGMNNAGIIPYTPSPSILPPHASPPTHQSTHVSATPLVHCSHCPRSFTPTPNSQRLHSPTPIRPPQGHGRAHSPVVNFASLVHKLLQESLPTYPPPTPPTLKPPHLPQELECAHKGTCAHLPAVHVAPLVHEQGQVAVGLHPLRKHVVDDCLGCGAHHQRLLQVLATACVGMEGRGIAIAMDRILVNDWVCFVKV